MDKKINVMIVDDSLSIRIFLQSIISQDPNMNVMAMAADPLEAMEVLKKQTPDVITLDVEMPNMDGITFLSKLMKLKPLPVVMFSTLTTAGSETAMKALEYGAVEITAKPSAKIDDIKNCTEEILLKIRQASQAKVGQLRSKVSISKNETSSDTPLKTSIPVAVTPRVNIDEVMPLSNVANSKSDPVWFIGASTGGPVALRDVLKGITDKNTPPILIAQHISAGFGTGLIRWLNQSIELTVIEAVENTELQNGYVYIPLSGKHLTIGLNADNNYICKTPELPKVNRHKPSVDVLMRSAANIVGKHARAVILTGMGDDGAIGLSDLHKKGSTTYVQEAASCVVDGMPQSALKLNKGHKEVSLIEINKIIKG